MELQQLRYFAKAAELESFTRAAEACFVTQPTLSQQILKLEGELGQPLFERLGRSVRLTEAGRLLRERADQIVFLMDDAKARMTDEPDAGRLVIGAIPTVAPYMLPGLIRDFAALVPRARLEVVEDVTETLLKKCRSGEVDIGFLALPFDAAGLHAEELFAEELLLAVPKDHPLAEKPRVKLADAADENFLLLNDAHCLTESSLSFCRQERVVPIGTSRLSQLGTVLELVGLGLGVSLVPEMARRCDTGTARAYRSFSGDKPMRTIVAVWNDYRYASKLFDRFVEWAKEKLPDR